MTAPAITIVAWLLGTAIVFGQSPDAMTPAIAIQENGGGAYVVTVQFSVPESASTVRRVLTDYEQIPRFMPGVRVSRVLERSEGRARVEQEATSTFMMFSKRVHLLLDIDEHPDAIRFRDRGGKSFTVYEGAWTLIERGTHTDVEYRLAATPAFSVPRFVLRRLLDRDARAMIDGLRTAIGTYALAR